jgi:hypothetical protein
MRPRPALPPRLWPPGRDPTLKVSLCNGWESSAAWGKEESDEATKNTTNLGELTILQPGLLTPNELQQFWDDGFVIKHNVFHPDELKPCMKAIDEVSRLFVFMSPETII